MLDIVLFRDEKTREKIKKSQEKRFKDASIVDKIFELDQERVKINYQHDQINTELNSIQKKIKEGFLKAKREGVDPSELVKEFEKMKIEPKERQTALKAEAERINGEVMALVNSVGNLVDDDVPVGPNDDSNVILRSYVSTRPGSSKTKGYAELMEQFVNAPAGTAVFGHRGYYLEGRMAHLARALKNYAIDFLAARDYVFIQTPVMMKKSVMSLTAQLSDFDEQLYKAGDDFYLIATSEQPLTGLFKDKKLTDYDLPKLYAGESLCFRKEAGAYGKDNMGIFRVHQFEKIEQFVVCKPEDSPEFHEKMIGISEEFYKSLDISFNVVAIASGELNDAASKKYDLEAYFPNTDRFRELVSASNCTDYQSRNLNVGYGFPKEGQRPAYVHMLNSTLCAVQRTLCCIVENYQDGDRIVVPEALRKYTGFEEILIE